MKRPTEPNQEDCCNSGCNPCIFDVYEKQLHAYKFSENGESVPPIENAISQLEYSRFYVEGNIDLKNQHRLLLFSQEVTTSNVKHVIWNPGDHFLIKYFSENQTCTRAYTPVKILLDECKYDFAIIIKRYSNGVVSNYLCDLKAGDLTIWRGPYGHYKLLSDKFRRIIMIAQGTGITPLHSIIKQVLNNEEDMTKIVLLYCCKDIRTILLREELYSFKSYWNFYYEVYLSSVDEPQPLSCKYQEPIVPHRLKVENLDQHKTFSESDQFLICGSRKFMEHYKQLLHQENIKDENIVTF